MQTLELQYPLPLPLTAILQLPLFKKHYTGPASQIPLEAEPCYIVTHAQPLPSIWIISAT